MQHEDHYQLTRRRVLTAGAGMAAGGSLAADEALWGAASGSPGIYQRLGVRPVINATGNVTVLGGSVMPPEVTAAWVEASRHFVDIIDLQQRVGDRIAGLVGVEAALVTTGAAGAMLLGTAAAVTLPDPARLIRRLPDTSGMRNEVILQKSHHSGYDNQLTGAGTRLIDVETVQDIDRVAGPRTALMFFMNVADGDGRIPRADWIAAARRHGIPTLLDASADIPPTERLSEYHQMGFDLVAISGGKAIRGPNDAGLLLGRRDLIDVARRNASPFAPTIGRMMKVSREDLIAMLAAVERFVRLDHRAEWLEMERRIGVIEERLRPFPAIQCERIVPPISNHQPHLIIDWQESALAISPAEVTAQLAAGDPPILLGRVSHTGSKGILIAVHTLQPGEEQAVAERLQGIFRSVP